MMGVLKSTIESNYTPLKENFERLENVNWDRLFKEEKIKNAKRKKTSSKGVQRLSQDEKTFLSIQKAMVLVGSYINDPKSVEDIDSIFNLKIDGKNFDELLTNIRWVSKEKGMEFMFGLDKLCNNIFELLYDTSGDSTYTIRENTQRIFYDILVKYGKQYATDARAPSDEEHLPGVNLPEDELMRKIATDIEMSVMMYTILMVSEVKSGDLGSVSWDDNLVKHIYYVKANAIIASLTNSKFNAELLIGLLNYGIAPIVVAFLKRSQLLPKRFEDMELNRLKIYEESGIVEEDKDAYLKYLSDVQCKICKLYHTSKALLQTRSADEPMTVFYYCYKCKKRDKY